MNNLTTFASTIQLLKLNEAHVMIEESMNGNPGFYSEEEVKNHIKSMLHEEHQMA